MYALRNLEDRINKYSKLIYNGDVCSTTLMKHSVTYIKTCSIKTVDSAVGYYMDSPILRLSMASTNCRLNKLLKMGVGLLTLY